MLATMRGPVAALALLAVVAAGCGGDEPEASGPAEAGGVRENVAEPAGTDPVHGGTLVIGLEAETNSWLPSEAAVANAGASVMQAVYDPLFVRAADGEVVPYLAESVTPNADFTRYSVVLREGVRFHDGTALEAAGIKAMFDEYLTAPGSATASGLAGVSVEVTGPHGFDYVLPEGDAAFLDNLLLSAGYPFSVEAARSAGADAGAEPVGTGPFRFESWTRGGELRLRRNEHYWRTDEDGNQLPYLDAVVFRPIPDEDTRLDSLASGDLDVVQTLSQSTVRDARNLVDGGGFESYEWLGNAGNTNLINTVRAPFDDVRVRRALALAIDAEQVIEVFGGTGVTPPKTQWFSPDSPWWSQAAADAWPGYDPEQASALLQEYVDDPDRSDGQEPGTPISFIYHCTPEPSRVEASQAYQAFWQQVGFEVELDQVEQAVIVSQALGLESEPPLSGDYAVQCWREGTDSDPYTQWNRAFAPWEQESVNFTNFSHPTITENVEALRTENDLERRRELVEEVSVLLSEQVPAIWISGTATAIVAEDAVEGLLQLTTPDGEEVDGAAGAVIRTGQAWVSD